MFDCRQAQGSIRKAFHAFLLVFLCLAPRALAETPDVILISTDQAQRMMLDNPHQLMQTLEPLAQNEDESLPLWIRLRAKRMYVEGLLELGMTARLKEWIPRLQASLLPAQDPKALAEILLIQSLLIQEGVGSQTEEEREQAFQNTGAAAERAGLYGVKAKILTRFSIFLTDKGAVLQAMDLQNEIQDLVRKAADLDETNQVTIKSAMAQLFQRLGQSERSLLLMNEVLDYAERMNLRYLAATTQLNVAIHYEKHSEPDARRKARFAFERAQSRAQEIDDSITVGAALLGLSRLFIESKDFHRAIEGLQKAVALFKEKDQMVWLGEAYLTLGRAFAEAGQLREANKALENAELYFPPDYLDDHNRILEQRAYNLFALGNKDAAFAALKEHVAVYKKQNNDRFQQEVSQLMVKLGLKVAEDRNALLIQENERQQQRLVDAERMRRYMSIVLALSALMMGFLGFSVWSAREVKKSRQKLQRILDNIDEGILTVDRSLKIEPHYSRHVHKIFDDEKNLAGTEVLKPLAAHTNLHPEAVNLLRESLIASVGSDVLSWELNSGHVPIEIGIPRQGREHRIAINWVPLLNKARVVEGFLLGLRDVSERRLLEAQIREEKRKSDRLTLLLGELAQTNRRRATELLDQVADVLVPHLNHDPHRSSLEDFKRRVHTYKGVARSLGLWEMSRFLHRIEDAMMQSGAILHESEEGLALRQTWSELFHDYRTMLHDLLEGQATQENPFRTSLLGLVSLKSHLLAEHLQQNGFEHFTLLVRDSIHHWPGLMIEVLDKVLIHALINAADHGYILPSKRMELNREPLFAVEARFVSAQVEIRIMDQGMGLDRARIRQLAAQHQIPVEDDASLLEVLFHDGVTTASQVTTTSGRGIGLAAVRSLMAGVHGKVRLQVNPEGQGMALVLEFPAEAFQARSEAA